MMHKLEIIRRILRCCYSAVFAMACMLFIIVVFDKGNSYFVQLITVLACFALSYIIREFAPNGLVICIFHLAMAGVSFFLPVTVLDIAFIVIICVFHLMFESLVYMKKNSKIDYMDSVPWISVLMCFVYYLFGLVIGSNVLEKSMYIIVMSLLVLTLISIYVDGICKYISCTTEVDGIPVNRIVKSNSRIVFAIIIGILVMMLLAGMLDVRDGFASFLRMFVAVVRFVATALVFIWGALISRFMGDGGYGQQQESPADYISNTTSESNPVVEAVIGIMLAALIIVFVYLFVRSFIKIFGALLKRRNYGSDIIENSREKKQNVEKVVKRKKAHRIFMSREERFRKAYKFQMEKYRYDIDLSVYRTSDELADDVESSNLGQVSEMNELYKTVRYGNRQVDRETLSKMRDIINKL